MKGRRSKYCKLKQGCQQADAPASSNCTLVHEHQCLAAHLQVQMILGLTDVSMANSEKDILLTSCLVLTWGGPSRIVRVRVCCVSSLMRSVRSTFPYSMSHALLSCASNQYDCRMLTAAVRYAGAHSHCYCSTDTLVKQEYTTRSCGVLRCFCHICSDKTWSDNHVMCEGIL